MHKELRDLMGSAGVDSLLSSGPVLVNTQGHCRPTCPRGPRVLPFPGTQFGGEHEVLPGRCLHKLLCLASSREWYLQHWEPL